MTKNKIDQLHDISITVHIKKYTKKNSSRTIFAVYPADVWFAPVVLDVDVEDNATLLSKVDDAFEQRHRPRTQQVFDLTETTVDYNFATDDLLQILSRNPSVDSYKTIDEIFLADETERIDG